MFSMKLLPSPTQAVCAPNRSGVPPLRMRASFLKLMAPYLLCLAILAPSVCWVMLDRSVWMWDQAYFGEETVKLYYTLQFKTGAWPKAMLQALPEKPPGVVWFAQFFVPIGKMIGSIDRGLHLSMLTMQLATLLMIYRIGQRFHPTRGGWIGAAGCLFVGSAPLFVGMSHQVFTEPLQTMNVTWFFYCALFASRWSRLKILTHLIGATSVAMLAKTTSPVFCFVPGLIALFQMAHPRSLVAIQRSRFAIVVEWIALVCSLGLAAATIKWYLINWKVLYAHAYESALGDVARQYGHSDTFLRKLEFWLGALRHAACTTPFFWLAVTITALGALAWAINAWSGQSRRPGMLSCIALGSIVQAAVILASFSVSIPEDPRYLAAVIPMAAIVFMWAIAQAPLRWIGPLAITGAIVQLAFIHSITLGITDWKDHHWLFVVERDNTQSLEVMRAVEATLADPMTFDRYNIVGVEFPWCNANSFAYYAAKHKLDLRNSAYYTSLGYAETGIDKAAKRMDDLLTLHFITIEERFQPKPPNFLNLISAPMLAKIENDKRFIRVPFPSQLGLMIFRRSPDLPSDEAQSDDWQDFNIGVDE